MGSLLVIGFYIQKLRIIDNTSDESLILHVFLNLLGMKSMQKVRKRMCSTLLERCKRQAGEDWPKISRTPDLEGDLSQQKEEPDDENSNEEISDEEPKKPTLKKWDLIKAFGCCNCSTTQ